MTHIEILLTILAGAFLVGFAINTRRLRKTSTELTATEANRDMFYDKWCQEKQKVADLHERGISLAPECEYCGDTKVDTAKYKELVSHAAEAHAFACPATLAHVPHYAAVVRQEKEEAEELKKIPVEVMIETHKNIAEEARKYGAKSYSELKAARAEATEK